MTPEPFTSVSTRGSGLSFANLCGRIAGSPTFIKSVFVVILLNAVSQGLSTYDEVVASIGGALDVLESFFQLVFVAELVIRIGAFGRRPLNFLRNPWNVFDLITVAASVLPFLPANATVLRLARLARVLRLARLLPTVRIIMIALGRALPGLAGFSLVVLLVLYVYGMVGWTLFGQTQPDKFGTIGSAVLTLFFLLAMDGLSSLVRTGMEETFWALPYYLSYVMLGAYLLINILVGIAINSLDEARQMSEAEMKTTGAPEPSGEEHQPDLRDQVRVLREGLDRLESELPAGR